MVKRLCTLALALAAVAFLCGSAAALPDAAIARIAVKGADLHEGDSVPVEVELVNRGDLPLASAPVVVGIDDKPYGEWTPAAPLAPGKSAVWSFTWVAPRGSHLIVATADPLNDVAESDETNNSAFINVGVDTAREPSPWPAAAAGIGAFLVGFCAAAIARRSRPAATSAVRHTTGRQGGGGPPRRPS
jgi:hypothetical protein